MTALRCSRDAKDGAVLRDHPACDREPFFFEHFRKPVVRQGMRLVLFRDNRGKPVAQSILRDLLARVGSKGSELNAANLR